MYTCMSESKGLFVRVPRPAPARSLEMEANHGHLLFTPRPTSDPLSKMYLDSGCRVQHSTVLLQWEVEQLSLK